MEATALSWPLARRGRALALAAAVAVAYYLLARVGLLFALSDQVASPIWPPAGLAVAVVALWGWRTLPGVFVGVVATELAADVPAAWSLLMAVGTTIEAAGAGWLVRRAGAQNAVRRLPGVLTLAAAALVAPLAAAATGTLALVGAGIIPASAAQAVAVTWYLGDVAGILIVGPAVLVFPHLGRARARPTAARTLEAAGAMGSLVACTAAVFVLVELPLSFLAVAPLVWIAGRFGPAATAWSLVAFDSFAVLATGAGSGPFVHDDANTSFLLLQAFALTVSLLCLSVAAMAADRRRASTHLEQRVLDRTHRLAELTDRFRALSDASPIGIVHTTPTGSVDYANAAWQRITGVTDFRNDAAVRGAIHPDDQPNAIALWERCAREVREYSSDLRWVLPDGTVRMTACRAVPIQDVTGQVTGFVSTVADLTERSLAEAARMREQESRLEVQRLHAQTEFKTNFLRTAAHELGTPLTPVKLQLHVLHQLLVRHRDEEALPGLAIIERNVDRLALLVRDLLDAARLQSTRMKLVPRPMDLADAIHETVDTFQAPALAVGVRLDANVPTELQVVADPARIAQVLGNLVSNALKFTSRGGRVDVQATSSSGIARVSVRDTGAGLSSEQAARLFQPFTQVHDAVSAPGSGTGLGLYISRGIIEQHGGRIAVHSAGIGHGCEFWFELPIEGPASAAPAGLQPVPGEPLGGTTHVPAFANPATSPDAPLRSSARSDAWAAVAPHLAPSDVGPVANPHKDA